MGQICCKPYRTAPLLPPPSTNLREWQSETLLGLVQKNCQKSLTSLGGLELTPLLCAMISEPKSLISLSLNLPVIVYHVQARGNLRLRFRQVIICCRSTYRCVLICSSALICSQGCIFYARWKLLMYARCLIVMRYCWPRLSLCLLSTTTQL